MPSWRIDQASGRVLGEIVYDASKPDGTPRKLVDMTRINGLGWRAGISLE